MSSTATTTSITTANRWKSKVTTFFVSAYCYIYAESVRKRNKFFSFISSECSVCLYQTKHFLFIHCRCRWCGAAVTTALLQPKWQIYASIDIHTTKKIIIQKCTKCNLWICPSEIQYADCVWRSLFNSDFRCFFYLLCFIHADHLWCTQAIIKIIFSFDWTRCGGATAAGTLHSNTHWHRIPYSKRDSDTTAHPKFYLANIFFSFVSNIRWSSSSSSLCARNSEQFKVSQSQTHCS